MSDPRDDLIRRGDAFAVVKGLSLLEGDILALPAVTVGVKPPFYFDRYISGVRMAEDVCVERETTLEGAMLVAARIASKGPNGEAPVLVYRAPITAPNLKRIGTGLYETQPAPDRRRDLVKAGALVLAEIERLDRAELDQMIGIAADWRSRAEKAEAENARLREALGAVAGLDVPRPVVGRWRTDGKPSKHDYCQHNVTMYADCPDCIADYARAALKGGNND